MWVVMTATAQMPRSCWGVYRKIALVLLSQHYTARDMKPRMISERARGVLRVIDMGRHSVGTTNRCAYQVALRAAEKRAAELNAMPMIADYASWGGSA